MKFAQALARKRSRFAFPEEFVESVRPIQQRIKEKHAKKSKEGEAFANCREIRVRAIPSWSEPAKVELWFLYDAEARIPPGIDDILDGLAEKFFPVGSISQISIQAAAMDAITAKLYNETYPLDLDHLSSS